MAVQATGAMAIVVADVPAVHTGRDAARALFTLSVVTGVMMLTAGFLRLGSVLRFVSNAVMVGFISELEVIPALRHYGIGLIPWRPLAGGLLAGALKGASEGRRAGAGAVPAWLSSPRAYRRAPQSSHVPRAAI